jgi:hypothetical protein
MSLAVLLSSSAEAALTAKWRRNPITPAALAANPQLATAVSVSLVVTLTGDSLFNVAGMKFTANDVEVNGFFNQVPFGSDHKPNAALVAAFPDLEFDTYVATTTDQIATVPGRYVGTGAALVSAPNEINVAWGATPNTGPLGGVDLEVARVTYFGIAQYSGDFTVAIEGAIRDSVNPNTDIPIPRFPNFQIPEPSCAAAVLVAAPLVGRRRTFG